MKLNDYLNKKIFLDKLFPKKEEKRTLNNALGECEKLEFKIRSQIESRMLMNEIRTNTERKMKKFLSEVDEAFHREGKRQSRLFTKEEITLDEELEWVRW